METFKYERSQLHLMERSCIPSAVFQFINNQIYLITVTEGFLEIFGNPDREALMKYIEKDRYKDCHPEDLETLKTADFNFAKNDEKYDVIFRFKIHGKYHIIHALGKHVIRDGVRLAIVWYTDEGVYSEDGTNQETILSVAYSNLVRKNDLEKLEQYDYLTGLPAISYFFYLIETNFVINSIQKKENPAIIFFDFNGMRYFNAKYGFAEGNRLIQAFSNLLEQKFTKLKCCRFGMDQFCVYTTTENLEDNLWQFFAECENINNGKALPVRAGIYTHDVGHCGASYACDRAKLACDSNRKVPVSHFTYFDDSMLQQIENRFYIIDNFERALKEGWIKVYYQPIVRAANGRVSDEEALSRWIDPVKGFMNPDDFIPILEDSKLIYKLDLYVAEQILQKMKEQARQGLYIVPISVNLSRSDFDCCDIVEEINKRVTAAGIPPEKLTIEITESIIGSDYDYMKSQILRFQSLGFKVWMDDFGSGYSTLDVLHDIPFNLIKLDMKFMQQFYKNDKSKIILTGLLKMAVGLGIETICEGVEKEDQVEFLKEVGCTKIQGYYYCKPISAEEVFERYKKGIQIGFENPDESEYYTSLGKINLYDLSAITNDDGEIYNNFFNTLPMFIIEVDNDKIRILRGNKTYHEFLKKYFGVTETSDSSEFEKNLQQHGSVFSQAIQKCKKTNKPFIIDENMMDGTNLHVYIRRIAINPVTNVIAFIDVILGANGIDIA